MYVFMYVYVSNKVLGHMNLTIESAFRDES